MSHGHKNLHRVCDRAGWICSYCGVKLRCGVCDPEGHDTRQATRDHVIPRARGGLGGANLVAACLSCNARKGAGLGETLGAGLVLESSRSRSEARRVGDGRCTGKRFRSEKEALGHGRDLERLHGVAMVAFECAECEGARWHLRVLPVPGVELLLGG